MYKGGIILKTPSQIEAMAVAGEVHAKCLKMLIGKCRPGVTTADLDEAAERFIASQGATPTFKGYRGFPGSICASPNSMVVHGIPDAYELKRGDVLSIDVGVTKDGWVADGAVTVPIGEVSEEATRLLTTTNASLHAGVAAAQPGGRRRRLERRREDPSRPRASARSAAWSATASAATCTRTHRCPTSAPPDEDRCSSRGWSLRSSR